jgi:hypothetical protein
MRFVLSKVLLGVRSLKDEIDRISNHGGHREHGDKNLKDKVSMTSVSL